MSRVHGHQPAYQAEYLSQLPGQSTGEGRCAQRPRLVPNGLQSDQAGEGPGGALPELPVPTAPVLPLLPTEAPRCRLHGNTPASLGFLSFVSRLNMLEVCLLQGSLRD